MTSLRLQQTPLGHSELILFASTHPGSAFTFPIPEGQCWLEGGSTFLVTPLGLGALAIIGLPNPLFLFPANGETEVHRC